VPLVPLSRDNGPTEFIPRSHSSWEAAEPSVVPTLAAGGYLVFDYRLRHRGLGNRSGEARPLLYLTYAKPFFADVTNFNAKRYPALPEVRARAVVSRRAVALRAHRRACIGSLARPS
jgi:ectoine hydroxylase-related dioxygenase (phytanoyl-CoA dioxygenase family)